MTPINEALSQINADIEALANKQNDAALFEKYQYLVARLSLENFRKVLQSLLPVEQQMMWEWAAFYHSNKDLPYTTTELLQLFTTQNEGK